MYYRTYTCLTECILVFRSTYLYFRSYTCITELILVLRNLYLYYRSCAYITRLILILQNLYLYYRHRSTRRYYRDFTCTKVPVGTTKQIQRYPYVLLNRYRGTRMYYRTYTEVPVGTFRSLPYSFIYSYSLFKVLSYNCWIA